MRSASTGIDALRPSLRTLPGVALLLWLLPTGGCHRVFSYQPLAAADLGADAGPPADAGVDVAPGGDAGRNAAPATPLQCTTPAPIGTPPDAGTSGVVEPGLRSDGLEAVGRVVGVGVYYSAKRPSLDQPFGHWAPGVLVGQVQDPSFFIHAGSEWVAISEGTPRRLRLCGPVGTDQGPCKDIQVTVAGLPIDPTIDLDGPSVAIDAAGAAVVAFNSNDPIGQGGTTVWIGRAAPNALEKWSAKMVAEVTPPQVLDDPAIAIDQAKRLTLVLGRVIEGELTADLWVAYGDLASLTFSALQPLANVNSVERDSAPVLRAIGDGKGSLELLFESQRSGTPRIYRTTCVR